MNHEDDGWMKRRENEVVLLIIPSIDEDLYHLRKNLQLHHPPSIGELFLLLKSTPLEVLFIPWCSKKLSSSCFFSV